MGMQAGGQMAVRPCWHPPHTHPPTHPTHPVQALVGWLASVGLAPALGPPYPSEGAPRRLAVEVGALL